VGIGARGLSGVYRRSPRSYTASIRSSNGGVLGLLRQQQALPPVIGENFANPQIGALAPERCRWAYR
jgi:hypothetical protein